MRSLLYKTYLEISMEEMSNNGHISIDNLDTYIDKCITCSIAIEQATHEISNLINYHNTINDSNIDKNISLAMESIDNLFGDSAQKYFKDIFTITSESSINRLKVSKEDIKSIIGTILSKIKEIFNKVVTWLKKMYIKFMVWWKDYSKELESIKERLISIVGDRLVLVQEDTLRKIEKLANSFLILYRAGSNYEANAIKLEYLLSYIDQTSLLRRFIDKNKFDKFLSIVYTKADSVDRSNIRKGIEETMHEDANDMTNFEAYSLQLGSQEYLDKHRKQLYYGEFSPMTTIHITPIAIENTKFHFMKLLDAEKCVIPILECMDLNYESSITVIEPNITKKIIENVYKRIADNCFYNLKTYIPEILKYQDSIKKKISEVIATVGSLTNEDTRYSEYAKHTITTANNLGSKLPTVISGALLYNTKLYVKILKLIADDIEANNTPFEPIVEAIKAKWKPKECEVRYIMGMKEFPYIHIDAETFKKIAPGAAAACVPAFTVKNPAYQFVYGYKILFDLFRKKFSVPNFILYNHEYVTSLNIHKFEYFSYFHELGHCLLNQNQTMLNEFTKTGIFKSGALDKLTWSYYGNTSYDPDYILSNKEVEANIFACLMTGYDIDDFIRDEVIKYHGEEMGARYKVIVNKRLPYIEKMLPVKFRFFSMLRP